LLEQRQLLRLPYIQRSSYVPGGFAYRPDPSAALAIAPNPLKCLLIHERCLR